jgi:hypothetical protein
MNQSRFYYESLPLLSSYFSGVDVAISDIDTSLTRGIDDAFAKFESQLVARHLISLSQLLFKTLKEIENNYSTKSILTREKSKGSIRGRLDISAYVHQKFQQNTFPRTYPVIVNKESPNTPENLLARALLAKIDGQLSKLIIPPKSAEFKLASKYRRMLKKLSTSPLWSNVNKNNNIQRLSLETKRRISRRQTGNESRYLELLNIVRSLSIDFNNLKSGHDSKEEAKTSLVFPEDKIFSDRVFEVWCLNIIFISLRTLGYKDYIPLRALTDRHKHPIGIFEKGEEKVEVWFQKSISSKSEWKYSDKNNALRGMPDIILKSSRGFSLLIDAKNKLVTTETRSEETYKILGYFENYKKKLSDNRNWGLLIFTTKSSFCRGLESNDGKRILLTAAHIDSFDNCNAVKNISTYINSWFEAINKLRL